MKAKTSRARGPFAGVAPPWIGACLFVGSAGCFGGCASNEGGSDDADDSSSAVECRDEDRFAQEVVRFEFGEGQDFGRENFPDVVLGGPRGGGLRQGSEDVVALGEGGFVEVGFGKASIIDGPGADFLVFENPFYVSGDVENPYAELGVVSVSEDGKKWLEFPCEAAAYPYGSCAGWHPVVSNVDTGAGDPFDPEQGGDPFDLADVGLERARFVRVTDRAGDDVVFDLDAVALIHAECESE